MSRSRTQITSSDVLLRGVLPFLGSTTTALAIQSPISRSHMAIAHEFKTTKQYKDYCIKEIRSHLVEDKNQAGNISSLLTALSEKPKELENLLIRVRQYSPISSLYHNTPYPTDEKTDEKSEQLHTPKIDYTTLQLLSYSKKEDIEKYARISDEHRTRVLLYLMTKKEHDPEIDYFLHTCSKYGLYYEYQWRLMILAAKRNQFNYFIHFIKYFFDSRFLCAYETLDEAAKEKKVSASFMQKYNNVLFLHPSLDKFLQPAYQSKITQQKKGILQQSDKLLADYYEDIDVFQDIATEWRENIQPKEGYQWELGYQWANEHHKNGITPYALYQPAPYYYDNDNREGYNYPIYYRPETTPKNYYADFDQKINHCNKVLYCYAAVAFLLALSGVGLGVMGGSIAIAIVTPLLFSGFTLLLAKVFWWNKRKELKDNVNNHKKYRAHLFETAVIHTVALFHRDPSNKKALRDLLRICSYLHEKNQLTRQMVEALDKYCEKECSSKDRDNYLANREIYHEKAISYESPAMKLKLAIQPQPAEQKEPSSTAALQPPESAHSLSLISSTSTAMAAASEIDLTSSSASLSLTSAPPREITLAERGLFASSRLHEPLLGEFKRESSVIFSESKTP